MKRLYVRRLPLLCLMSKLSTVIFILSDLFIRSIRVFAKNDRHNKNIKSMIINNPNVTVIREIRAGSNARSRRWKESPRGFGSDSWKRTEKAFVVEGRRKRYGLQLIQGRQALLVKTWIRACRCKRYWTNPTHAARSLHLSLLHHIPVSLRFTFKYSNKRGIAVYRRVAASST